MSQENTISKQPLIRYGKRLAQTVTAGAGVCSNSVTVDATTNRITGAPYAYDANGNMTNDGANSLTYDAQNRAVTAAACERIIPLTSSISRVILLCVLSAEEKETTPFVRATTPPHFFCSLQADCKTKALLLFVAVLSGPGQRN